MRIPFTIFQHSELTSTSSFGGICALSVMLCTLSAGATERVVPWECTGFAGEVQNRCIRTFAELQQEKNAKLERDLEVQQRTVQQRQQQVAQQAFATADLGGQLTRKRSRWYGLPFVQIYPPFGLSLRFGRDTFLGGALLYAGSRHYVPKFYGHGHPRWRRY